MLNKNGRLYFTCRSHNVPIYMKVQIIHQTVAKTKTVLSAKVTLMNTRPVRHTFILCIYVYITHIIIILYIISIHFFLFRPTH